MNENLKLFYLKLFSVVFGVFLLIKLMGNIPLSVNTRTLDKDTSFYVNAEASTYVKPDTVLASFSVEATSKTAGDAQKQMNEKINKISEELGKLGVNKDNIKTTNYSMFPLYNSDGKVIESYRAVSTVQVKEKNLEKVNEYIDKAVEAGATQVSGVTFEVEDRESAVDEARKEAIAKAKDKAQRIAGEAGIRLGRILNVSEYTPGPMFYAADAAMGKGAGGGGETQIEPGQTEIKINVTLTYETL